jgi:hypothetical protein
MATVVAPVSTTNCMIWPLMLPWPLKWPPLSAVSVMRRPEGARDRGRRRSASGARPGAARRCPFCSTVALSRFRASSFTPWALSPTRSVRGAWSITSSARSPKTR